jgi:hypothetical protein
MTCRDLARVARHIVNEFPEYYQYYNERSFTWNNITQENRNPTLARVPGADGLKTGHTEEAGYGLTASAKRGDRRLILVFNGLPSMRRRGEESERLLEWGFREFENVVLFRAADVIEEVPVHLGGRKTVPLVGGKDVVVTLPRQWRQRLQAKVRYDAPIAAPVLKGQELGRLEVAGQGVPNLSLPLLAGADVDRLGLVSRIPAVIGPLDRRLMERGRFVTLEGGEGAGKSTQAGGWSRRWRRRASPVLRTREPGGAPGAEAIRTVLLGQGSWDGIAECMLHFAARREHVERTIRPALEAGTWVVSDRFADSTLAYQCFGQGVPRRVFDALAAVALEGCGPTLRWCWRSIPGRASPAPPPAAMPIGTRPWMPPSMPASATASAPSPRRSRIAACCWTRPIRRRASRARS